MMRFSLPATLVAALLVPVWAAAQEPGAGAWDEGERAIAGFRVPAGMKVELFAAEPLLANPVAFALDAQGRAYVVETYRHSDGVTDTRGHMYWLDDDLASRTVEDRVAMFKKHLSAEEFERYGKEQERIRLVEDRDGDGRAETSAVFADGFGGQEAGLGAGVLPYGGWVYFTCIPDLYRLKDTNGDGAANVKESLSTGYGVHVQFIGHDLHGPIIGPDGRLYFTIGDRGFNVTTVDGQKLAVTDRGSVLRCELDGSKLEVIHTGLRNPQELAFDEEGNLFTVDNNSDGGDKARLVWVVPGGDSGWRVGWQFIEQPNSRGPWNSEKMWEPKNEEQPAFLTPALANFSDGPSGLAYNPGTGLGPEQRGRFFLADFRGATTTSGVRSFAVKRDGAAFALADQQEFLWGFEATDVAFGTDGNLYISDWIEGWNKTGKGRIYRLSETVGVDAKVVGEVRTLLTEGMGGRGVNELAALLDHMDMRVRQEAQFELAARGKRTQDALTTLSAIAYDKRRTLTARRHGLWGVWQVERSRPEKGKVLVELLRDEEPEIRVQAARVLADLLGEESGAAGFDWIRDGLVEGLLARLEDEVSAVRFQAAIALGNLGDARALTPLVAMLADNDDKDAYLRHAGVMGLAGVADAAALVKASEGASSAVRLAILLALRRQGSVEVAQFLDDEEPRIVLEAARAIHDADEDLGRERLGSLTLGEKAPAPLVRRVIAANERRGGEAGAKALAAIAVSAGADPGLRAEAIEALGTWAAPSGRDRVTGLWRPIGARDAGPAVASVRGIADGLLAKSPGRVMTATARAAGRLGVSEAIPGLQQVVTAEKGKTGEARLAALEALGTLKAPGLTEIVAHAVDSKDEGLRASALAMLGRLEPARALPILRTVVENGSVREKQRAFATLGGIEAAEAETMLVAWLDKVIEGTAAPEVRLDVVEAARKRGGVADQLKRYEESLAKDDVLAEYRVALAGGDAREGGRIFREKAEVYCLRCHKVGGQGGEVGPELGGIGQKKDREYLLESIAMPSKTIAEGFETRVVAMEDGTILAGVVKGETDEKLTLITPEAKVIEVEKARIEEMRGGDSAMPSDLIKKLTAMELRDLIEFLATVR